MCMIANFGRYASDERYSLYNESDKQMVKENQLAMGVLQTGWDPRIDVWELGISLTLGGGNNSFAGNAW